MPPSSQASDFDAESPRCSDASMSAPDWPPEPRLRSLRWRVLLGVLPSCPAPIESLRRAAANGRRRYAELRRRLIVDPHTMEDVHRGENLSINNPLSQDPDSVWGHYFKNTELEKSIENDLTRLYPEHGSFFQGLACQSMLRRILLVWALSHSQYGYRQGMHEVLAPLVYVLHLDVTHLSQVRQRYEDPFEDRFDTPHEDKVSSSREGRQVVHGFSSRSSRGLSNKSTLSGDDNEWIHRVHPDDLALVEPDDFGFNLKTMLSGSDSYGAEGELGALLSGRFMEHDAYCMFDALLRGHSGAVALADYFLAANEGGTGMSGVLDASTTMYLNLAAVDPPLYIHLVEIGVEPQFFALRWFRVLFGREFDLEMLLHLWDAIFAASHSNAANEGEEKKATSDVSSTSTGASFISNFAVSMILYLRSTLLAAPNATVCLQKLLNFPKHIDVRSLIENAKVLQTLSEEPSKSFPSPAGKHTRFLERSRGGRHKNGSPSPSFHGHMSSPSKVLQHRHSGSSDMSRHPLTESYWEEQWMNSVLTKEVSEDACADAGATPIGFDSGNVSGSNILEGLPVSGGTSLENNSKQIVLSKGVSLAHSNNLPTRRSLFASFFKGLLSFEDRKSDATVSSSETKTSTVVVAPDTTGVDKSESKGTNFNGAESNVGKEDPGGRLASTEGGTAAEVPVSDIWTSDDGETSCSGDEGGRLHCTSDQSIDTVSEKAFAHPPEAVGCVRRSESHEESEHDFTGREESSIPPDLREANRDADTMQELRNTGCPAKVTTEKHSKAVLQTLGNSMVESIQVIENALSGLTKDGAPTAYRETAENLSKALLNGKGHLTALSALAELRKISSLLLQM
eukprot:c18221_g2_i1 orf=591-3143(-)